MGDIQSLQPLAAIYPLTAAQSATVWHFPTRTGLLRISSSNLKLPMPSVESAFVQGYNRVAVNAALNTSQSVLEIAGSWVVLAAMPAAPRGRLAALGAVSIACASLFAIVGVCFLLKADWTRLTGPHSPSTFPVDFDALTRSAALVSNHSVRSHPL